MKVVSFHSWGEFIGDPETKTHQKLDEWKIKSGISYDPLIHQVFGFNNPNPKFTETGEQVDSKDNPYGYEIWITIPEDFKVEDNLKVKTVEGGLYGVISIRGIQNIGKGWKLLVDWIHNSEEYDFHPNWKGLTKYYDKDYFEYGTTGLELHTNYPESEEENFLMDIYAPIKEK